MSLSTEDQWVYDRIRLYKLREKYPKWSQKKLADALGYSLSWVKKWLARFRQVSHPSLICFASHSRAPKNPAHKVTQRIRDVILSLRQLLPEKYGRVVGAKPILYHLHHNGYFQDEPLPTSSATIWRVLKQAGYMPQKIRFRVSLDPSPPMHEWEFDYGEVTIAQDAKFEIAPLIDGGTSILMAVPVKHGTYQADTTLDMLISLFCQRGFPARFRFDRDSRLIGSAGMDDYPSALIRFAWCIGMEPIICEAGHPQDKPYVERAIRTLKHECLYVEKPTTQEDVEQCLSIYIDFYNTERAHQGLSCNNQPPMMAHPDLPALKALPKRLNPDAWLDMYHGKLFKRQVSTNGSIKIDNYHYQVGRQYALRVAAVHLDAMQQVFRITVGAQVVEVKPIQGLHQRFMDFDEYANIIVAEALAAARQKSR
jgi:hypothetical protein